VVGVVEWAHGSIVWIGLTLMASAGVQAYFVGLSAVPHGV